jgi:hypothetical protein
VATIAAERRQQSPGSHHHGAADLRIAQHGRIPARQQPAISGGSSGRAQLYGVNEGVADMSSTLTTFVLDDPPCRRLIRFWPSPEVGFVDLRSRRWAGCRPGSWSHGQRLKPLGISSSEMNFVLPAAVAEAAAVSACSWTIIGTERPQLLFPSLGDRVIKLPQLQSYMKDEEALNDSAVSPQPWLDARTSAYSYDQFARIDQWRFGGHWQTSLKVHYAVR